MKQQELADRLAHMLDDHSISVSEMGKALGMSRQGMAHIIAGSRGCSATRLVAIIETLAIRSPKTRDELLLMALSGRQGE